MTELIKTSPMDDIFINSVMSDRLFVLQFFQLLTTCRRRKFKRFCSLDGRMEKVRIKETGLLPIKLVSFVEIYAFFPSVTG